MFCYSLKHMNNIFAKCGLELMDLRLEFGLTPNGTILLADEICPDKMKLRVMENMSKYMELFRAQPLPCAGYRKLQRLLAEYNLTERGINEPTTI